MSQYLQDFQFCDISECQINVSENQMGNQE